ncbi:MAG: hypothetical protein GY940_00510, partial [bacterium]|nr:hypothetical protein [bacterium]
YFIALEQLPLTPNGKLDTNALPAPQTGQAEEYAPPRNKIEQKMVDIWASVLGKDKIGIHDNFFGNGGDSIKSIQIMSRMNSAGYKLNMKDLFQYPAISQLTPYVKRLKTGRSPVTKPKGFLYRELGKERLQQLQETYKEVEDIYILSPMQEGMLFHALTDSSASTYFQQTAFSLSGDLDILLVEKSLNQMISRHDVLRTAFVHKDTPRPLQVVLKERAVDFYFQDISHIAPGNEKEAFVREFKANDTKRPFNLSHDILMRVSILKLETSLYEFVWSFHHILMDGWCVGILNNEFFQIYTGNLLGRPHQLPPLKPYRTYIQWLEKQDKEQSAQYWENVLDTFEEPTGISSLKVKNTPGLRADANGVPVDAKNDAGEYDNRSFSFLLDTQKTAALKRMAARNHVTLNIVNQAVWGILLGKYNGKEDVVFGAVVSGRPSGLEGVESMIGLFINTIPVRIRFQDKMKFRQLIQNVQQDALSAEPHHYHPLVAIQSRTHLKQNLLDHLFIFENFPLAQQIEGYGNDNNKGKDNDDPSSLKLTDVTAFSQTNYDLNLMMSGVDRLNIGFNYNSNVVDEAYVKRLTHHFQLVLEQVSANEELAIEDLTLLSPQEKQRLLHEFNGPAREYPEHAPIHQLFAGQVEKTPNAIALLGPSIKNDKSHMFYMSYKELNHRARELAVELRETGT